MKKNTFSLYLRLYWPQGTCQKLFFHVENPVFLEAAFFTTVFRRCVLLNIQNAAMHSRSRFQTFVDWPISLINKWRGVIRSHGWVVIMRNSQDWSCLNLGTPEKCSEGVPPFGLSEILVRTWLWYRSSSRIYPPLPLAVLVPVGGSSGEVY